MGYHNGMRKVEFLLDDQTDELLTSLAESHDGDLNEALRELVRTHGKTEALLDDFEKDNRNEIVRQLERSESDFREGRFKTWDEVKRNAGL